VPTSDVISGSIGEGVDEILGMRRGIYFLIQGSHIQLIRGSAPVIVAFTKFDREVAIGGGSSARSSARARVDQSCRSLFRRELRDVPAEIVSGICSLYCGIIL